MCDENNDLAAENERLKTEDKIKDLLADKHHLEAENKLNKDRIHALEDANKHLHGKVPDHDDILE